MPKEVRFESKLLGCDRPWHPRMLGSVLLHRELAGEARTPADKPLQATSLSDTRLLASAATKAPVRGNCEDLLAEANALLYELTSTQPTQAEGGTEAAKAGTKLTEPARNKLAIVRVRVWCLTSQAMQAPGGLLS